MKASVDAAALDRAATVEGQLNIAKEANVCNYSLTLNIYFLMIGSNKNIFPQTTMFTVRRSHFCLIISKQYICLLDSLAYIVVAFYPIEKGSEVGSNILRQAFLTTRYNSAAEALLGLRQGGSCLSFSEIPYTNQQCMPRCFPCSARAKTSHRVSTWTSWSGSANTSNSFQTRFRNGRS